jgi:glucose-6-phosphate isomerase
VLAKRVEPALTEAVTSSAAAAGEVPGLDPSTTALVAKYRELRGR